MAGLSVDGDYAQQGHDLGKGQKRRIGKNAAPNNITITSGSGSNNSAQPSTLNPHAQLRLRLIDEGIDEPEIDRALEEMWERELPYDDFNAVLSFIHCRNAVKEQTDSEQHSEQHFPPEEETKTASTVESTSTSRDEREHQRIDGVIKNDTNTDETNSATDSTGYAYPESSKERQIQRKATVHPINMSSKLDLVADYENLADAAFALSEWVAKAADREEIHELCMAQKTRALSTVMRRTIAETADQIKFAESVLPSMLHLIGSIFLNAGMSSTAASATRKNLESVMQLARQASMKKNDPEQVFADRVARYIVSKISESIDDLKTHGNDEGVDLILRLEDEIESLASSLATGEGGVIELISKRDANKIAAEKSSTVFGVAMATTFRGFEMPEETDESASVDKDEILVSLVGKSGVESMKAHKRVHEDLTLRKSSLHTTNSDQYFQLQIDLDTYQAERSLVAERMEELRLAMRQLEEDDAELTQVIIETEQQISEIEGSSIEEAAKLADELQETEKVVDFEATIDTLAGGLKLYEESLKKAVTVSNIFENCENIHDFVPSKLGVYLVHVKNYLTSESECIDFLRKRVTLLEKDSRDLNREIKECQAMGMSATVSQMSDALSLNGQNISDDTCVVVGLVGEAQNMMTNLIGRLDQFVSDDNLQQQHHQLNPLHVTLVRGIAGTVEMMGLEDIDRLKGYLPNNDGDFPTVVTTSHDENDQMNGSDTDLDLGTSDGIDDDGTVDEAIVDESSMIQSSPVCAQPIMDMDVSDFDEHDEAEARIHCSAEVDVTPQKKTTNPDLLVRKLTWANPTVQSKKQNVKSLLEIQKEELSHRNQDQADET